MATRLLARARASDDQALTAMLPDIARRIVHAPRPGHAGRHQAVLLLALAQWANYEHTVSIAPLSAAIETLEGLVATLSPTIPGGRTGSTCSAPSTRRGTSRPVGVADLTPAVATARSAVDATDATNVTPDDRVKRARYLETLATALTHRCEGTGTAADLDEGIRLGHDVLALASAGGPEHRKSLQTLARRFHHRFELRGAPADLDQAVELARRAVDGCPEGPEQAEHLTVLSGALAARSVATGSPTDVDAAVEHQRTALRLAGDERTRTAFRSELGARLRLRFERTGAVTDLDDAVVACRAAVDATPGTMPIVATDCTSSLSRCACGSSRRARWPT
ncbi:hypothetical protein ACFQYP_12765 [Nonomuraea antimicrobica]